MDLNKVMFIGNITSEPETKATPSGVNFTKFSLATNRRWKDQQTGEMKEDAQFHNIVAWRGLSDVISKYAHKGKKIYVEGRLTHRSYDGQDGQKKYWTEVVADNIILLGAPGENNPNTTTPSTSSTNNNTGATEQSNNTTPPPTNEDVNIPATEEIPTIDVDADTEEIKVEDIPF